MTQLNASACAKAATQARAAGQQATHFLVAETAKEFAKALYETCMHDNTFYKFHPKLEDFVEEWWPKLVPQAKATLAEMLAKPGDEKLKEQIAEALIMDNTLTPKYHGASR